MTSELSNLEHMKLMHIKKKLSNSGYYMWQHLLFLIIWPLMNLNWPKMALIDLQTSLIVSITINERSMKVGLRSVFLPQASLNIKNQHLLSLFFFFLSPFSLSPFPSFSFCYSLPHFSFFFPGTISPPPGHSILHNIYPCLPFIWNKNSFGYGFWFLVLSWEGMCSSHVQEI